MFGALYALVGETEFNGIVGGYYQQYAQGGTVRDFVQFAARHSTKDLMPFFDDWLFSTRWTRTLPNATSFADIARHYNVPA